MREVRSEAPESPQRRTAVAAPRFGSGLREQDAARSVLALQRAIGNRETSRIVAAAPRGRLLQRYKILGPWNKGQPVHETLTVLAVGRAIEMLKASGKDPGPLLKDFDSSKLPRLDAKLTFDPVDADRSFQQFIRGVVWADDPKGWLFDKDADATKYSSGLKWYSEFSAGGKGRFAPSRDDLIARSHFGDLQFFHGMASTDDELPSVTKGKMLAWARVLVDVAASRRSPATKIKDIPAIKDLFPANGDWTVKRLFVFEKATDMQARQRAVGVLFHMIQDSFAHGHVQRDPASDDIQEFHAYGSQDEGRHAGFDQLGKGRSLGEQIPNTLGAASALKRCAEVLAKIAEGDSTDEVIDYIDSVVLKLAPSQFYSGPGGGLGKKGTTPADKPVPKAPAGDFPIDARPYRDA